MVSSSDSDTYDSLRAEIDLLRVENEQLRAAQWPEEATEEMKEAVYKLDLGSNHLSEDDVIDIYDMFKRIVEQK